MKTLNKKIKVVFSGGGTLGPVTPLLAMHDVLKEKYPNAEFVWVGTKKGPEKELIDDANIRFVSLPAGKLRRYFSLYNIFDLFKIKVAFIKSLIFLKREKPSLCISAGGFVSVPLHWAASLYRIPTWIHQQDEKVGLSNKLMAKSAKVITVALSDNIKSFPGGKTIMLGNPIRKDMFVDNKSEALGMFGLSGKLPVLFVTGGGTGAEKVNNMVADAVEELKGVCEIIHLSGKERKHKNLDEIAEKNNHYNTFTFFTKEMKYAYATADLVVSRGGFGTLTELSALEKPAIIIPIPGQQEDNVSALSKGGAVIMLEENLGSGLKLAKLVKKLLNDRQGLESMSKKLVNFIPLARDEDIVRTFEKILD